MKIYRFFVLTLLIGVVSPAFAKESFLCVYLSGDMSFDVSSVLIERDGKDISVFRVSSGKEIRDDRWSYQVLAEHKELGLQAIRSNPPNGARSTVAVEYGGLLFLIWGEGKLTAYVVSAQASTKKTESQVLACERR
jgi:hypothetical protein